MAGPTLPPTSQSASESTPQPSSEPAAGPAAAPSALRTLPVGRRVRVSVPATSANLGPGFDALGLAVELRDAVEAVTVDTGFSASVEGEGAGTVPTGADHLILSTVNTLLAAHGYEAPGLRLHARNVIPHGRGLGSSAAAHATAVLLADALLPEDERASAQELLHTAAALEGHPDNVAPALVGGLALSWSEHGHYHSVRVDPHDDVVPVVAVPAVEVSTSTARGLLPAEVPHGAAAANAGRAALLVHALTVDPSVLLPATRDWLHQDYRSPAMPESAALVRTLRESGHAAVVSGAGPTVLVLAIGAQGARRVREAAELAVSGSTLQWRVRMLPVARRGATVEVHH